MTASFTPAPFRAILMGDESLTIACGDMVLAGGHEIAVVVTRDDAVRAWAEGHDLPVLEAPGDLPGRNIAADWLLSIANLRMIPDEVLALPAKGSINFHDGPLPRYAGLNTPAWAIINGETSHGVSWHLISGGVDEGDLLAQKRVEIARDETALSLNAKCYAAGMESFGSVLAQLESGDLQRMPQDLTQRSYFARDQRPADMAVLDFTQSAQRLSALVRGLDFGNYWNPLTTPKLALEGRLLRVSKLEPGPQTDALPGTVLDVAADHLVVAAADKQVVLRGVTDLDGHPGNLVEALQPGDLLIHADLEWPGLEDEAHWRAALHGDPLQLWLAGERRGAPDWKTLPLDAAGQSTAAQARAAQDVALQAAGPDGGDLLAFAKPSAHAGIADWVPLQTAPTAKRPLDQQIDEARSRAGMARSLALRDPEAAHAVPQIALSDADPVSDAALTIVLSDSAPRMIYDATRLSDAAADILKVRLETALMGDDTLPQREITMLRDHWNATDRAYDLITIHAAFEAQVRATPAATALVFEDTELTYANLNARANRVAHRLRAMGAGPGTPVALATRRDVDLLVGALGILKAGAAYVPVDPGYPADRIAHYIADSGAPIVVTQSALNQLLPDHAAQVLELDTDTGLSQMPDTDPEPQATADDLAYLIYTSGSTGTPKGVMVSHGNVANFFAGMDDRIPHEQGAVWLAVTSLSFDISVLELFWTLSRGFKLVLAGDESRTQISHGPVRGGGKHIDFNLFYWGNDDGVGPKKYELLLKGAQFADANGFNAIWTPERHFHAFGGPYPNPSVTGAAVAAVTRNLDIRAGSCVAPLHHPARIAEEWAVIDNLTNGRTGLAIASGWQPDDFVLRPENTPPDNKPAMYAAIDQLRKLWAGEPVEFPKNDGTLHPVVTQPRPVSARLPIWVTTAGNPQTWKEAGEIGANVLTHLLGQSIDEVADKIRIYHEALRDAGHDPADFKVSLMLHSYLAETRAEAEAVARGPMKDYLRAAAGLIKQYAWAFPAFKKPKGATSPFQLDLESVSDDEMDGILEFAFQRYFNDSGLFGTIEDGVARTEQLRAIGVDEICCLIDYGIAPDVVLEGLKPLAEVLRRANAAAVLDPADFSLATQLVRHEVTHLQCTPSMAQMLVMNEEARAALGGLEQMLVGGEALPGPLVDALKAATPARLHNMYGPTETTIWSTSQEVGVTGATAPIGTPIANTQVFILDEKNALQPVGVAGSLWIGGDGVTKGYWHREELTAERFIDNPFGPGKLYNTGDLAAWDADGTLHFMGRADAQVKIRGHRIELGEIEARLAAVPGVTQAVVIAREAAGGAQLVGYVTTDAPFDETAARQALAADLPAIMVPGAFVVLESMPLTPNKKIDRKALPAPKVRAPARADAPVSAPEPAQAGEASEATREALAEVWQAVLGVTDVRGEDNFFALGGHSLLAVQAHRDIRQALGVSSLSITDIFRFPVLNALAAHIDKGQAPRARRVSAAANQSVAPTGTRAVALSPEAAELQARRRDMRAARERARA